MKALFWIFVLMAVYGAVVGKLGAGLLALLCALGVLYAIKRQDQEWLRGPRSAKCPRDTQS